MPNARAFRHGLVTLLFALISVALAGCFDQKSIVTINADGSLRLETEIRADKEVQDIAVGLEALAAYDKSQKIGRDGLCGAAAVHANKHAGRPLKVRQFIDDKNFVCIFSQDFSDIESAERSYLFKSELLRIVPSGTRRYTVTLDFGVMRGLSALLESGATAGLQHKFGIKDPGEVDALYRKLRTAYAALLTIMTRNRKVVLEVRGAKVLSTNGVQSEDGAAAHFEFTWTDIFNALIGKGEIATKTYVVELAY